MKNSCPLQWEPDFSIRVRTDGRETTISANKAGLQSLASHLLQLAEGKPGDHLHLDEHNSLEDGSTELIIERID